MSEEAPEVQPVQEAPVESVEEVNVHLSIGQVVADAGQTPNTFEVVALVPGRTITGFTFPESVLLASVPLWEGASVFVDHVLAQPSRKVEDCAGVLYGVRFDGGVRGRLRCTGPKGQVVASVAAALVADRAAGQPVPNIGLSADLFLQADRDRSVTRIVRVNSLDMVMDPAAGGAFVRALNSQGGGTVPEDVKVESAAVASPPAAVDVGKMESLAKLQCEHTLTLALKGSGLPDPIQDLVRAKFSGKIFEASEIEGAIKEQQTMLGKLVELGVIKGLGAKPVARQMFDEVDRLRFAWERALGLSIPDAQKDVPRLSGIRELYCGMTGDLEFRGRMEPERATFAAGTTTTMAGLVVDGFNKRLLQAYNKREKWWEPIVTNRDLDKFADMKMIRPFGFASLSDISEGGPYTEKTWDDVKETASIAKKGNYVGLTLEMIMADDMDAVRAIPTQLGTAGWNALSDAVSYIFTQTSGTGPLLADGGRLFNATAVSTTGGHANLLTTALSEAELGVVQIAMGKQAEPGSARRLGLHIKHVLVPTDLYTTAVIIRNTKFKTGSANNDANPFYEQFEVIEVPPFTDTKDWVAVADPNVSEGVVLGWLFGRREPEIFVADDQVVGSMFTNDEMRIKARFFTCVGVADFRGLHKSNVT